MQSPSSQPSASVGLSLPPSERAALIDNLKRRERAWMDWGRWMALILGVLELCCFVRMAILLSEGYPNPARNPLLYAAISTAILGFGLIAAAVTNWSGTPRRFLIALAESR
jgi:hypothetical protein